MATISKILTPDGTKLPFQQLNFTMTRFWKVCTKCEYERLINSGQYWQCMNKKSLKIDRRRVIRSCEETYRNNEFSSQKEKIETEISLVKTQNVKNVSVERKSGSCQWTAKGQCSKGDARMPIIQRRIRTVSFKGSVCTIFDFSFLKYDCLWETVLSKVFFRHFCVCGLGAREDDSVFFPRSLSSWRKLQACQQHKTESGCKFGEKCAFRHIEVDSQPSKKPKTSGGKGSVPLLKNSKQLGCVFQEKEPPKSKSISRRSTESLGPKRSVHVSKRY